MQTTYNLFENNNKKYGMAQILMTQWKIQAQKTLPYRSSTNIPTSYMIFWFIIFSFEERIIKQNFWRIYNERLSCFSETYLPTWYLIRSRDTDSCHKTPGDSHNQLLNSTVQERNQKYSIIQSDNPTKFGSRTFQDQLDGHLDVHFLWMLQASKTRNRNNFQLENS